MKPQMIKKISVVLVTLLAGPFALAQGNDLDLSCVGSTPDDSFVTRGIVTGDFALDTTITRLPEPVVLAPDEALMFTTGGIGDAIVGTILKAGTFSITPTGGQNFKVIISEPAHELDCSWNNTVFPLPASTIINFN